MEKENSSLHAGINVSRDPKEPAESVLCAERCSLCSYPVSMRGAFFRWPRFLQFRRYSGAPSSTVQGEAVSSPPRPAPDKAPRTAQSAIKWAVGGVTSAAYILGAASSAFEEANDYCEKKLGLPLSGPGSLILWLFAHSHFSERYSGPTANLMLRSSTSPRLATTKIDSSSVSACGSQRRRPTKSSRFSPGLVATIACLAPNATTRTTSPPRRPPLRPPTPARPCPRVRRALLLWRGAPEEGDRQFQGKRPSKPHCGHAGTQPRHIHPREASSIGAPPPQRGRALRARKQARPGFLGDRRPGFPRLYDGQGVQEPLVRGRRALLRHRRRPVQNPPREAAVVANSNH